MGPSNIIGERSIINKTRCNMDVITRDDVFLCEIERMVFEDFIAYNPQLLALIKQLISQRDHTTHQSVAKVS